MMSTSAFHIHLYGRTDETKAQTDQDSPQNQTNPIPTSFEAAETRLTESLSALFEPDGSFAWAGPDHQIVGIIYDAAGQIQYAELRGRCDAARLRLLVQTIAGTEDVDDFAAMILPERQWKSFQSFESSLP